VVGRHEMVIGNYDMLAQFSCETLTGRGHLGYVVIDAPIILRYITQRHGCSVALNLYRSRCGPMANFSEDGKEHFRFV
jgi:hypothetical protein